MKEIKDCIALLNSMVASGENHSETSKKMVEEAMSLLKQIQQDETNTGDCWAVVLQNEKFTKLLAIQTHPELKYYFKDKEVALEEIIDILQKAE